MAVFEFTTTDELIKELSKYKGMAVAITEAGDDGIRYEFHVRKHPTAVPDTICIEAIHIN